MYIFLQSIEIHGANGSVCHGKLVICVCPTSLGQFEKLLIQLTGIDIRDHL